MTAVIYLIPLLLALALITWVYFDATELGKPAIPWAIAQPMLWWLFFLPLILYVIFREQGPRRRVPPGGARRQAAYILSFVGYAALAYGLSALLAAAIVHATGELGDETFRQFVSSSVAAMLVGSAIWAAFWLAAERRLGQIADDAEFWATFYLHRAYLYTAFGISWLVVLLASMLLVGGAVNSFLDRDFSGAEAWVWAVGPLAVALLGVVLHYAFYFDTEKYKELLDRFNHIPAPLMLTVPGSAPAVAVETPPTVNAIDINFCRRCGAALRQDDVFCARCGAPRS